MAVRKAPSLQELANQAGVEVFECDSDWGGKFGYRVKGENCAVCGFRTHKKALERWFEEAVGENLAPLLLRLLRKDKAKKPATIKV